MVVLSGDHGERLAGAKALLQSGVAPTLVMAGAPDSSEAVLLCQGGQVFEVICLRPLPDNTRAEARATAALASSRHWRSVVVVTSIPHVARSRLLFSRCFTGRLDVVGAELPYGGSQAIAADVHEVLGLVYARSWARSC
ncbi:MAG: YdcF family protein [Actinomycetota bacterium]|nr:YdcF family protein [Actinomycetota bacterium]